MPAVHFNAQWDTTDVAVRPDGKTACIDLWYPRCDDRPEYLEVGLVDVRAADGIRLHYDFDRDGFVVEQPKPIVEKVDETGCIHCGEEWIEVGFFQSWKFNHWEDGSPPDAEVEAAKTASSKNEK